MNLISLTQLQVSAIAAMLANEDDEQLKLDTLEGETDLFELARSMLNGIEQDEGAIKVLGEQIADRQARKVAADNRIKRRREAVAALLECADLSKLALPEATISVLKVPPKAIVTDPEAVPDEFCTFVRKPDLAAIKAADKQLPGVTFDNGGVSITVRRK